MNIHIPAYVVIFLKDHVIIKDNLIFIQGLFYSVWKVIFDFSWFSSTIITNKQKHTHKKQNKTKQNKTKKKDKI